MKKSTDLVIPFMPSAADAEELDVILASIARARKRETGAKETDFSHEGANCLILRFI